MVTCLVLLHYINFVFPRRTLLANRPYYALISRPNQWFTDTFYRSDKGTIIIILLIILRVSRRRCVFLYRVLFFSVIAFLLINVNFSNFSFELLSLIREMLVTFKLSFIFQSIQAEDSSPLRGTSVCLDRTQTRFHWSGRRRRRFSADDGVRQISTLIFALLEKSRPTTLII